MTPTTIGPCTLYHADCLQVHTTLDNASIDFVFTDPPYGHNNNNGDLIHHWEAALGQKTATPASNANSTSSPSPSNCTPPAQPSQNSSQHTASTRPHTLHADASQSVQNSS